MLYAAMDAAALWPMRWLRLHGSQRRCLTKIRCRQLISAAKQLGSIARQTATDLPDSVLEELLIDRLRYALPSITYHWLHL